MPLTIDNFHALVPEYAGIPDDTRFKKLLTIAETRIQGPDWDQDNAEYAAALLVAHMIKITEGNGRHAMSSEKDGGLAAAYHIPEMSSANDQALAQTSYGLAYIGVRDSLIFVNPVV